MTPELYKWLHEIWVKRQEIVWYNIIHDHGNTFGLSKTITASHRTEESALKVIEDYKNKDVIRNNWLLYSDTVLPKFSLSNYEKNLLELLKK